MVNDLQAAHGSPAAEHDRPKTPSLVYVVTTVKGGAGKTEVAECLDVISTFNGHRTTLIDVDDGNRGLVRRVGGESVVKVEWCTSVLAAPNWVATHATASDVMIFDLGAGIDSSDLPVMAFLKTTWRMLVDRGARMVICAVVSTNAPTSNYVERLERRFGELGEVVVVCNNQDGSEEYPAEVGALSQQKLHLAQLPGGVQAVRLSRRERLGSVVGIPAAGYELASALMAKRILAFADQGFFNDHSFDRALRELRRLARNAPAELYYTISKRSAAADHIIRQNVLLAKATASLLRPDLTDEDILAAAIDFRSEHARYRSLPRCAPK